MLGISHLQVEGGQDARALRWAARTGSDGDSWPVAALRGGRWHMAQAVAVRSVFGSVMEGLLVDVGRDSRDECGG